MNNSNEKSLSTLLGAAFIMATSAIGPAFMTQTSTFTEQLGAAFGFVILASTIIAYIAQINVWTIISVSKLRAQDIANEVFNGLGYLLAILITVGGLVFNIGNVGGAALGIESLFGFDVRIGAVLAGIFGILIFSSKEIGNAMDKLTQIMGILIILLCGYIAIKSGSPIGLAVKETFIPSKIETLPILTLVGGTVGGYIVFSGGHRLVDAGVVGEENLDQVKFSARMGIGVALVVRILLFLAVLGVVSKGIALDPNNPAATTFEVIAGNIGLKIFSIVFLAAALTSIVGCAYTSVTFLKTFSEKIDENENKVIILFIVISTLVFLLIGRPAKLLVLVGSFNGLILPLGLGLILLASRKASIIGEYEHPKYLVILGWIVVLITAVLGVSSLSNIRTLWIS